MDLLRNYILFPFLHILLALFIKNKCLSRYCVIFTDYNTLWRIVNSIFLISALFCNFSFINFHELTTFTNFFEYFTRKRIWKMLSVKCSLQFAGDFAWMGGCIADLDYVNWIKANSRMPLTLLENWQMLLNSLHFQKYRFLHIHYM